MRGFFAGFLILALAPFSGAMDARAQAACALPPVTGQVQAVRVLPDGGIETADGAVVRLADMVPAPGAAQRLGELVVGRQLVLRVPPKARDRWGRVIAYAEPSDAPGDLAALLLSEGLGHAAASTADSCLATLIHAEGRAREKRLGIWAGGGPGVPVADGEALQARLGEHVIAEAAVVSARAVGTRVYLNFARYWRSGLSMVIAQRDWAAIGGGATPESFVGRRIRVRGWLEWRGGPALVANRSEPVEATGGRPPAGQEQ